MYENIFPLLQNPAYFQNFLCFVTFFIVQNNWIAINMAGLLQCEDFLQFQKALKQLRWDAHYNKVKRR